MTRFVASPNGKIIDLNSEYKAPYSTSTVGSDNPSPKAKPIVASVVDSLLMILSFVVYSVLVIVVVSGGAYVLYWLFDNGFGNIIIRMVYILMRLI